MWLVWGLKAIELRMITAWLTLKDQLAEMRTIAAEPDPENEG